MAFHRLAIAVVSMGILPLLGIISFDTFIVTTNSMQPTLIPGDILLCSANTRDIEIGDVVVFAAPAESGMGVKRVLAGPGDLLTYTDKQLQINGSDIEKRFSRNLSNEEASDIAFTQLISGRQFVIHESYGADINSTVVKLGRNEFFVMGDSRDHSIDSRHFGVIHQKSVDCVVKYIAATEEGNRLAFERFGSIY